MRFLIKQRLFTVTDKYDIYDEWGEPVYFVKSQAFSFFHKIHVYDRDQREVGMIREHWGVLPKFEIFAGGRSLGWIQGRWSLVREKYQLDYNNWTVEGDLPSWNYRVLYGNMQVMHLHRELFNWGDTYVLDIMDPRDELPGLMLAIAIDAAACTREDG